MFGDAGNYDASNTMFSPEGRLFQVEYAREAIKKGSTVLAMKYKHGVVFATQRARDTHVVVESSAKKLFRIGDTMGGASSGLVADARVLVDYCRSVAIQTKRRYDEPILIEILVKRLGNILRGYTQYGGVRPFGVAFFVGGIDTKGIQLFETDISGAIRGYRAGAIGRTAGQATELLEERYRLYDGKDLALKELISIIKEIRTPDETDTMVEILCIDEKKGFLSDKITDIDSYLAK